MDTRHRWPILIVLLLSLLSVSASAYADCGRDLKKCTPAELESRRAAAVAKWDATQKEIIRYEKRLSELDQSVWALDSSPEARNWSWPRRTAVKLVRSVHELGVWVASAGPGNRFQDLNREIERIGEAQASQRSSKTLSETSGPSVPRASAGGGR